LRQKAEKLAARRDSRTKWSEADQENAIAQAKQTSDDPHKLQLLRSAFAMFDLDGGGSIEASELYVLLEGLGIKMSQEEALDLVHEVTSSMSLWPLRRVLARRHLTVVPAQVDDDGSGVVEFEEFVILMQRFIGTGSPQ
jgi:Ca2+-binding EF-hand superfamily protein